jgi:hypothetical protein
MNHQAVLYPNTLLHAETFCETTALSRSMAVRMNHIFFFFLARNVFLWPFLALPTKSEPNGIRRNYLTIAYLGFHTFIVWAFVSIRVSTSFFSMFIRFEEVNCVTSLHFFNDISGHHSGLNYDSSLQACNAMSSRKYLPTFRMTVRVCLISVTIYQSVRRNNLTDLNFEVSHPRCVYWIQNPKMCINQSEHNCIKINGT